LSNKNACPKKKRWELAEVIKYLILGLTDPGRLFVAEAPKERVRVAIIPMSDVVSPKSTKRQQPARLACEPQARVAGGGQQRKCKSPLAPLFQGGKLIKGLIKY